MAHDMIRRCGALSGREYAASFRRFAGYWQDHLDSCRMFIAEGVDKVARQTTATVLGASEARDLPLEILLERFDQVNLVDIDEPSLQAALAGLRQNPRTAGLAGKVRCIVEDVTGDRLAQLVGDCCNRVITAQDPAGALRGVLECYERYEPAVPDGIVRPLRASYVISSGVASQLLPLVLAGVSEALQQRFPRLQFDPETQRVYSAAAAGLRGKLLEQHARTLAALTEDEGRIAWWDTVAKTPAWRQMTELELRSLFGVLADQLGERFDFVEMGLDLRGVLRDVRDVRQVPDVLVRLIEANRLPVQGGLAVLDKIVERAREVSANARAPILPGGLADCYGNLLVPDGPVRSWRWVLNPLELASLHVEAVHLKKR
jgi:hypothetical protein